MPSRHLPIHTSRNAFTLIELLVVILLIGALLSLVLAGVQSIRESARSTNCLANLRQLFHLTQLYAQANNGWVLRNGKTQFPGWMPSHQSWVRMMEPQWRDENVLDLALSASQFPLLRCPATQYRQITDYAMNACVIEPDFPDGGNRVQGPTKLAAVRMPSNVVLLIDTINPRFVVVDNVIVPFDLDNIRPGPRNLILSLGNTEVTSLKMIAGHPNPSPIQIVPRGRHGTYRVNALRFDGSADSVDPIKLTGTDFDDGIHATPNQIVHPSPRTNR